MSVNLFSVSEDQLKAINLAKDFESLLNLPIEWLIMARGIIQAIILFLVHLLSFFNVYELYILMPGLFLDMSLILIYFPTHGKPSRVDRDRGRIFDHWWCSLALYSNLWLKSVCNVHKILFFRLHNTLFFFNFFPLQILNLHQLYHTLY